MKKVLDQKDLCFDKPYLWIRNFSSDKSIVINQGGTSSGKTYCIMDMLLLRLITERNIVISVVGQNYPNLWRGAARDALTIWSNTPLYQSYIPRITKMGATCPTTNSVLEFVAYQSSENAKSGKRDYLFINEATGIDYEIFQELQMRTKVRTWIDFNPTSQFWAHKYYMDKPEVEWIYSTHLANKFLPEKIHQEIENLKITNPEKYEVYGLGKCGKTEGLIIQDWSLCDVLPDEYKWQVLGLDFGYSCFKGDTLIKTKTGDKFIKDINYGDMVLTSDGYMKVLSKDLKGKKETFTKKIITDLGETTITATPDHLFKTTNGWKQFKDLTKKDILYSTLCSKEKSTQEIQIQNTQIISTIGEKSSSIEIFIKSFLEKFQRDITFITLIKTLSTMISVISGQSHQKSTVDYIQKRLLKEINNLSLGKNVNLLLKTGVRDEKRLKKLLRIVKGFVLYVVKNSFLQTHIKNTVLRFVIVLIEKLQTNSILKESVNFVEKFIEQIDSTERKRVHQDARINLVAVKDIINLDSSIEEVYDLTVEGVHEYFANEILVHNCDPTAVSLIRYSNGQIWVKEILYNKNMLNVNIADELKKRGLQDLELICDSAEPKSIEELRRQGLYRARGAIKGKDSILSGIDTIKSFHLNVTRDSDNIQNELLKYKWKKDNIGNWTNVPEDKWNHSIDSIRYALSYKIPKSSGFKTIL